MTSSPSGQPLTVSGMPLPGLYLGCEFAGMVLPRALHA